MNRTVFSLPVSLHSKVKAMADRRQMSVAAFIRETLEGDGVRRLGEARVAYSAVSDRQEELEAMKRIVISLPEEMHRRLLAVGQSQGISMAAYIRNTLEERTSRERPKPQFGAFESGFTDTGRMAGEFKYEARSWR